MSDQFEQEAILDSAMKKTVRSELLEVHTALPGEITEVDLTTQLVTVQMGIKRILMNGQEIVVPPQVNVPLGVLRGGNFVITLPVTKGDQCLVIFSEREMTQWMFAGDQGPQTPRRYGTHQYSDAIVLPMLASSAKKIANYNPDSLEIRSLDDMTKTTYNTASIVSRVGGVSMTLDATGLHVIGGVISSNVDVTANGVSLTTHVHISAASGSPTSPPVPGES